MICNRMHLRLQDELDVHHWVFIGFQQSRIITQVPHTVEFSLEGHIFQD